MFHVKHCGFLPNLCQKTDYFLKFLSKILANYYIICYYLFVQQIYCKLVRLGIKQPYQSMFVCTFFEVKNE